MKKLYLNDKANLFILAEYYQPKKRPFDTPFGTATEIYTNTVLKPAKQSEFGSEAYRASLSRAFNRAKKQIYFNPDMNKFITLTYAENMQDMDKLLYDVKQMIKTQKRQDDKLQAKYLFIVEKQSRGALHVHMIANNFLDTYKNKNAYKSITHWPHGFSSILDITDLDSNFKPYLYLFKYLKKSQRIGKSFTHTSNNLKNYDFLTDFHFDKRLHELQFKERTQLGYLDRHIEKVYYKKGDKDVQ